MKVLQHKKKSSGTDPELELKREKYFAALTGNPTLFDITSVQSVTVT